MGTSFDDIFDQFMMLVKDYRLVSLYDTSVGDFSNYLQGWLIPAIRDFSVCDQSLLYSGTTFTETLTSKNIIMLSQLMKKYWIEKELNDITQMQLHLQDKDFHTYAEANSVMAKQKLYIDQKEEVSQLLVDYSLKNTVDWANWYPGVFYVP